MPTWDLSQVGDLLASTTFPARQATVVNFSLTKIDFFIDFKEYKPFESHVINSQWRYKSHWGKRNNNKWNRLLSKDLETNGVTLSRYMSTLPIPPTLQVFSRIKIQIYNLDWKDFEKIAHILNNSHFKHSQLTTSFVDRFYFVNIEFQSWCTGPSVMCCLFCNSRGRCYAKERHEAAYFVRDRYVSRHQSSWNLYKRKSSNNIYLKREKVNKKAFSAASQEGKRWERSYTDCTFWLTTCLSLFLFFCLGFLSKTL